MIFCVPSVCHAHVSIFARSLLFLTSLQRFVHYNMHSSRTYVPIHALRKIDIESMLSVAFPLVNNEETQRRFDHHHSRRTMLHFLMSVYHTPKNERVTQLIKECSPKIDLEKINAEYNQLKSVIEPYQRQYRAESLGAYWELQKQSTRSGPTQSRTYISKYRENGFQLNELKLYWNYDQIKDLHLDDSFNSITDTDSNKNLKDFPVSQRKNSGLIKFVRNGIQNAVFQVPAGKQIIVLDFADERMPGGYFLENARTQEEVILFNSDGYRALLDLKYQIMNGGYILPEYGVAYIKNVRFFQDQSPSERITDLIVGACYDLSGMNEGLYKPPSRAKKDELQRRTTQKIQAIIASAVANSEVDGRNVYLLLGPIGTGAFANDVQMIADIFSSILNAPLMNSENSIRYAFEEIWFVSIDDLSVFSQRFSNKL